MSLTDLFAELWQTKHPFFVEWVNKYVPVTQQLTVSTGTFGLKFTDLNGLQTVYSKGMLLKKLEELSPKESVPLLFFLCTYTLGPEALNEVLTKMVYTVTKQALELRPFIVYRRYLAMFWADELPPLKEVVCTNHRTILTKDGDYLLLFKSTPLIKDGLLKELRRTAL